MSETQIKLPKDVVCHRLTCYEDERGWLTEIYREEWQTAVQPVQWNIVSSCANTLRGVHVHFHQDYLFLLKGEMLLVLKDLRPDSPTFNLTASTRLLESEHAVWMVPTGVAHGFYFPVDSITVYGLSHGWSGERDIGFRWDDPEFDFTWPTNNPILSERDANAPSLQEVRNSLKGTILV